MKLSRGDLWSLEEYSDRRVTFRAQVMAHKKLRQIQLGPHATLYFEDLTTMKYQVQEMLRIEKIFTGAEIEEELAAYNPLIPDGSNLKATFMLEYPDAEERRIALARLGGIEHLVWIKVGDADRVFSIANEDMERTSDDKAAAVHFMRFEFDQDVISAAKSGAPLTMGIDHAILNYHFDLPVDVANNLINDFD